MIEYDKEELTQTISTEELIRHFRNEEEVSGYCRECENFGESWGCPPFDFDVEDRLKQYKEVLLVATKKLHRRGTDRIVCEDKKQIIYPDILSWSLLSAV